MGRNEEGDVISFESEGDYDSASMWAVTLRAVRRSKDENS